MRKDREGWGKPETQGPGGSPKGAVPQLSSEVHAHPLVTAPRSPAGQVWKQSPEGPSASCLPLCVSTLARVPGAVRGPWHVRLVVCVAGR